MQERTPCNLTVDSGVVASDVAEFRPGLVAGFSGRFSHSATAMPVISRFYGIIIRLLRLPGSIGRIYANYGEHELVLDLPTLEIVDGSAPLRVQSMVLEWARAHHEEIEYAWRQLQERNTPATIEPLR